MSTGADLDDGLPPPPVARGWTRQRVLGHALLGLWALLGAMGLAVLVVLGITWVMPKEREAIHAKQA